MKIYFNIPEWGNRWIPHIINSLKSYQRVTSPLDADILFSAWCNEKVVEWSHNFKDRIIISYCRRYEIYQQNFMCDMDWSAINGLIFVSKYTRDLFLRIPVYPEERKGVGSYIVHNGIDVDRFKLRQPVNSTKIAMIASTRWVKGHQLAAQVLMHLPSEYTIHSIGLPGSLDYAVTASEYIMNLGLSDRFIHEGLIDSKDVSKWLEDKRCLLSCSMSEGNPMNVIEAMAMGVPSIVHNWPGASDQFMEDSIFNTPEEAASKIMCSNENDPNETRGYICQKYSLANYNILKEIVGKIVKKGG